MRDARYWCVFAICSFGWLTISLLIAPLTGGLDVMYFRDPGWNLASTGSFVTAGMAYTHDLVPRIFSYYTPLMPLLFAGYLFLFPRNAYAGTIFNLLLGVLAAGCALYWVIRSANGGKFEKYVAVVIAVFPVAFIVYDRPEILGYPLACVTMAYAARARAHPIVAGLLISITFLAHPLAAVLAAVWVAAFFLLRIWETPNRLLQTLRQLGWAAASAALVISPIAMLYYSLDPTSLSRFVGNGLAVASVAYTHKDTGLPIFQALKTPGLPLLFELGKLFPPIILLMLFVWILLRRKRLHHIEWIVIGAGFLCIALTVSLFPTEGMYPVLLVFLIPTGFLIANRWTQNLSVPGLVALLVAVVSVNLPGYAISVLFRLEQRSSYLASKQQPAYLLAQMPAPDGIVALAPGDPFEYDLFKPEFRHLINTLHLSGQSTSQVAAIVNCYGGFKGGPRAMRPLPQWFDASEFHMIQPAPAHMWITIFGHRVSNTQRGFGCDLYLRNTPVPYEGPPHS